MSNDNYEELDVHSFIEPKYKTKRFKITMTNETKQTSVELFAIALYEGGFLQGNGDEIETLLNRFKEMENERIIDSFQDGKWEAHGMGLV